MQAAVLSSSPEVAVHALELPEVHQPLAQLVVVHVSEVLVLPCSRRLALLEALASEESVSLQEQLELSVVH